MTWVSYAEKIEPKGPSFRKTAAVQNYMKKYELVFQHHIKEELQAAMEFLYIVFDETVTSRTNTVYRVTE